MMTTLTKLSNKLKRFPQYWQNKDCLGEKEFCTPPEINNSSSPEQTVVMWCVDRWMPKLTGVST